MKQKRKKKSDLIFFFFFLIPQCFSCAAYLLKGFIRICEILVTAVIKNRIARMHWRKCSKAVLAIRSNFRMKECRNPLWISFVYFKKCFLYLSVCDFWWYTRGWHKRSLLNSSCEGWRGWDCSICTFLSKALHCSTDTEYDLKFYFGIELDGLFVVKGF